MRGVADLVADLGKIFIDTNVLVYVYDDDSPAKQAAARRLIQQLFADGTAAISTQVLQEFYVTVTRKLRRPVDRDVAFRACTELSLLPTVQTDSALVLRAVRRSIDGPMSLWDALILEAALDVGAAVVLTEDMQHGRDYGGVRTVNPFVSGN